MSERASVYVLGCGAVGSALSLAFGESGVLLEGAHCRTEASAARAARLIGQRVTWGAVPDTIGRADIIILSVPDPEIRAAAESLASTPLLSGHQVALHCSGSRSAEELSSLRPKVKGVASFHPLLSFADPVAASRLLASAAFAVEGDAPALAEARGLATAIGGFPLDIPAEDRVIYHAAAATASNHLVALTAQAANCLSSIGVERSQAIRALLPLMSSTLENLSRLGLPNALTGPVSRGDANAVSAHLEAIESSVSSELVPYRALARRALEVAREQGAAPVGALSEVEAVLQNGPSSASSDAMKALDRAEPVE